MSGDASEQLVQLDRIGTVPQQGDDLRATVWAPGLPEASRRRFEEDPRFEVLDGPDDIPACDVALLSTRSPRGELLSELERFRTTGSGPAVVLVHTGGEATAVDLVRNGAVSVLGEGGEAGLAGVLSAAESADGMLEAYDRNTTSTTSDASGRGIDAATGLLDELAMKARVEELVHGGDLPRVAFIRLLNVPSAPRELSFEGMSSLRRRIATQFQHAAERAGAALFAVSETDFGLVGPDLSPNAAEGLARSLQGLAGAFAPTGLRPMGLALGHAGPEAATDGTMLMELASRARDLAAQDPHGGTVSAELLALGMASSTELAAAMQTLAHVERRSHHGEGHGERVAELAASLASELGYDGASRTRIRLAAHLHEIGKASLPPEAIADPDTLDDQLRSLYRSHSVLGANFLRPLAGDEVATLLRAYPEHWDGSGGPDGTSGHDIPTGARVITVAHCLEATISGALRDGHPLAVAVAHAAKVLQAQAGTVLDPDVANVAVGMVQSGRLGGAAFALAV